MISDLRKVFFLNGRTGLSNKLNIHHTQPEYILIYYKETLSNTLYTLIYMQYNKSIQ